MPKPADVMITVPVYYPQHDISKFLKVKPAALGILEVLLGLLGLGLTIWRGVFSFLWSPIFYIGIGFITALAAGKSKPCLVKSSQILSYVNTIIGLISIFYHLSHTLGVPCFIFVACDILTIIFSITVAATSCSCCCTSVSRHEVISYTDIETTLNNLMLMDGPNCSALAQPVGSVMYVLPAAQGSVPPASLPNCSPFPSRPPPDYSPAPSTPPPSYEQALSAPPLNYGPIPSAPPKTYETR